MLLILRNDPVNRKGGHFFFKLLVSGLIYAFCCIPADFCLQKDGCILSCSPLSLKNQLFPSSDSKFCRKTGDTTKSHQQLPFTCQLYNNLGKVTLLDFLQLLPLPSSWLCYSLWWWFFRRQSRYLFWFSKQHKLTRSFLFHTEYYLPWEKNNFDKKKEDWGHVEGSGKKYCL